MKHPMIWPDILEVRMYQKSIADIAYQKNTLVILPTALGKTIISMLIAANFLYNYVRKKILIMLETWK